MFHRREGLPPPRRPPAHRRGERHNGWRLAGPHHSLVPATSETKPFKVAATRDFSILQNQGLANVLRLLTLAVSVYCVLWVFPSTRIDVYTDPRSSGGL
jgi:hypothetical protein